MLAAQRGLEKGSDNNLVKNVHTSLLPSPPTFIILTDHTQVQANYLLGNRKIIPRIVIFTFDGSLPQQCKPQGTASYNKHEFYIYLLLHLLTHSFISVLYTLASGLTHSSDVSYSSSLPVTSIKSCQHTLKHAV